MNALEIIESFKGSISYADECKTVDLTHIYKDFHVMRHEEYWFVPMQFSRMTLLIDAPMHLQLLKVYLQDTLNIDYEPKLCVIWGGTLGEPEIEQILRSPAMQGITPFWTCYKTQFAYWQWVQKVGDGIDWQRTIESTLAQDPKIIMEWD
jgi:hypothetical protein